MPQAQMQGHGDNRSAPPRLTDVVNVARVPHRSPFRYPGGKTWLVPHIRRWLASFSSPPSEFYEPFAGGGIVGLTVAFERMAQHVTLVELDEDVGAVWETMLHGNGERLASEIVRFELSPESVRLVLDRRPRTTFDRAFATIVRNRVQRGGILAPGAGLMKSGENGRGLLSRWYPMTLQRRILDIVQMGDSISFMRGDGVRFMEERADREDAVFFIDPPYTVAGRRLYSHSEVDHERLFAIAAKLRGDFLMTYDNAGPIRRLAEMFAFETREIAMKNTHHAVMTELLVGRDLSWVS